MYVPDGTYICFTPVNNVVVRFVVVCAFFNVSNVRASATRNFINFDHFAPTHALTCEGDYNEIRRKGEYYFEVQDKQFLKYLIALCDNKC
jgi:hypothetical protein